MMNPLAPGACNFLFAPPETIPVGIAGDDFVLAVTIDIGHQHRNAARPSPSFSYCFFQLRLYEFPETVGYPVSKNIGSHKRRIDKQGSGAFQ